MLLGTVLLGLGGLLLLAMPAAEAQEEAEPKVSIKGRIVGGNSLLNPVWSEAKDPKNHRYSFRVPSATVGPNAKKLTAYLPKELCIVALTTAAASPSSLPVQVHVSGGRTTPSTLVVAEGQNVQFVNDDPFPHKLYDAAKTKGGMAPEDTKPTGQRIWKPPAVGKYEIRDAYFPSVRTWIVVEPKAAGFGFPKVSNPKEFIIPDLLPGTYELQAYFKGEPVGKKLPMTVRPKVPLQPVPQALVVAEKKKDDKSK